MPYDQTPNGGLTEAQTTLLDNALQPSGNLSGLSNAATARSNLGLAIGTNVQAYSANLATIAALGLPPSPWHVLGSVAGTFGWIPRMPEAGERNGIVMSLNLNSGGTGTVNGGGLFTEDAATSGLTTVTEGLFRNLTTSASQNDARGFYVGGTPRSVTNEYGYLFAGRIRIPTITDARYVFAVCEDTGVVGLLDEITAGDTQTTRYGLFVVISSTTGTPGLVSVYASASGVASSLTSTGLTCAAGDVFDVFLMTGNGALGASKDYRWEVVRRTNTVAMARGVYASNTPATNSTMKPAFAVRTLAAAAINIEIQSLTLAV